MSVKNSDLQVFTATGLSDFFMVPIHTSPKWPAQEHRDTPVRRYRQVQTGTDRYRQVQTGTDRYRQVQTGTDRYRPVQTGTDRYISNRDTVEHLYK